MDLMLVLVNVEFLCMYPLFQSFHSSVHPVFYNCFTAVGRVMYRGTIYLFFGKDLYIPPALSTNFIMSCSGNTGVVNGIQ